jgi:hypothetical protein
MKKINWNKVVGVIMICLNSLLVFDSLYWYYMYNFSGIMFLFMVPYWVLFVNSLLGIVGIIISILLYKEKINVKLFVIFTIAIWLIALKNYSVF